MLNDLVLKLFKRVAILMAAVGILLAVAIAMIYSDGNPILWKALPSVVLGFTAFGIGIDNFKASRRRRILWALAVGVTFSLVGILIEMVGQSTSFSILDFLKYFVSFAFLAFLPEEFVSRR
ncbi:MAG TPA: hypothetical protein VIJ85_08520 [Rhizomicrobium sp.]